MSDLKKNTEHIVTIEGYNSAGLGIARVNGRVLFVKNAVNGERCCIKVLKAQKNTAYAIVTDIIDRSRHRKEPTCPVYGRCGGCDFLHMDYDEELSLKRTRVEEALRRIGGITITVPPVVGSEEREEYRNKGIFAVGRDKSGVITGFYRQRSHDIVAVEKCIIQTETTNKAVAAVKSWMDKYSVTHYDKRTKSGAVRHIFCRYGFTLKELQVVLVTAKEKIEHLDFLITEIRESCPETVSIVQNINKTESNTVLAGEFRTVWGMGYIEDELSCNKYRLTPQAFYQINSRQAERIYEEAVALTGLTDEDTALDLYCGTGTITLLLARQAKKVVGAEIVREAVECAEINAERNGVKNVEFICAGVSEAAAKLKDSGVQLAAVVVDPPRKGLTPDVISAIVDMSPRRVVYISCDPATLARDMTQFMDLGYKAVEIKPYDMFPGCAHVECVALLLPR